MKQSKSILFLSIYCICLSIQTQAANRFWVSAAASNWNNTSNWSNVSGGAGGFSVPGLGDVATFNNLGLGNCTLDIAVSAQTFTVTAGYTGTITQGANTLMITNIGSFSGGTFTGGSANMTVGGNFTLNGTTFTSTTAVFEIDGNATFTTATFTHNNGTVYFNATGVTAITGISPAFYILQFAGNGFGYNITSAGSITVADALNLSGTLFYNLNTGTINVAGNIDVTNTASGCGGTGLININGAGAQNFNGSAVAGEGALPQLTINKASGTLNLANFPASSNAFTYTAGTVNPGASTYCFTNGSANPYTITGSLSLNNISFLAQVNATFTIAAASTLTATGNLTLAGTSRITLNTGNINVDGNIELTNTAAGGGGTATITIQGAGAETLDGTAIAADQSLLPNIVINSTGTLALAGNISFSGNVTYTAGTVNPGTSTCYIINTLTMTGTFALYNITFSGPGNINLTIALGSTVTATNTLDFENAANFIKITTGTLAVQGDFIDNNTATTGGGTGTILINGTGAQAITATGVIDQGRLPSVTLDNTGGTITFPSLITIVGSSWTYIAGTLNVSANNSMIVFENTMTITGNQTLNNITFDGSANYTFTTAAGTTLTADSMNMIGANNIILNTGNINLNGSLILTNTSVNDGGTTVISFVAAVNQSIVSALPVNESSLPAITINKSGGTLLFPALITVRGNWTYTAGTYDVTTNNATIVFAAPIVGANTITGTHTLNNVTLEGNNNNNLTVSTGTILTVTGTLTTTGAANVFVNTPVAGATAIEAQGNITINNTSAAGGGTGLILINGTGAQLFSSSSPASEGLMPNITIQKTSGTLTLSGVISESRDWTYTSGTVDATTDMSTVVFGGNNLTISSAGMSFYNVEVTANISTLSNNMTVTNNLTISGGHLAGGANTINLSGNWNDYGAGGFTLGTSTVNFIGSSLQTITNPAGEDFYNLTTNNSGVGIQLENNADVAEVLNMTQGNIDLNSNTLTLGTAAAAANIGTLTYTAGTMINGGTFTRWFAKVTIASGSPAGLFPVGNINNYQPFYISASVAPTTGGTVSLTYSYVNGNTLVSFPDGASTVAVIKNLNWALTTGNGLAGGTYNIEAQGTGFGTIGNVADLRLTLVGSAIGVAGVNAGTIADPQVNTTGLTLANLTNSFYIGSVNYSTSPLPMDLLSFTASLSNQEVELNWTISSEIEGDYFTIQRSQDAQHWESLEQVSSDSSSSPTSSYEAMDQHPFSGTSFYRLMLTDPTGNPTYSQVRTIIVGNLSSTITIYPNPASDHIIITFPQADEYAVSLLSSNGQSMNGTMVTKGINMVLDVSSFNPGVYFIRIDHDGQSEIKKVVIYR